MMPPNWIKNIVAWICRDELLEAIEGDLLELYIDDRSKVSKAKADLNFLLNALAMLRYNSLLRKGKPKTQNNMDLLSNYLKISIRNFGKSRVFFGINIFGLTVAFTAFFLILQFVLFETSYDKFHSDYEKIYRVVNDRYQDGERVQRGAITYPVIGPLLVEEYEQVTDYTRMTVGGRNYLEYKNELFLLENYIWADENFLKFFDFKQIAGSKAALNEIGNVVISKSFASRFLKQGQSPETLVGQIIKINDWDFSCKISGVLEDIPKQSHLDFDVVISYKTFIRLAGEGADNSKEWSDFYHYLKFKKPLEVSEFQDQLDEFGLRHFGNGEISGAEEKFSLQPLNEIHLDDSMEYEYANVRNGKFLSVLIIIGLLILTLAWINYINLTSGRVFHRAKEVGVRRVLGAHKRQVIFQFISECFLVNAVSLLLSLIIILISQTYLERFISIPLSLSVFWEFKILNIPFLFYFIPILFISILVVGLIPSILQSKIHSGLIFKTSRANLTKWGFLRKSLVVFQFGVAFILISTSTMIFLQVDYMRDQDLGVDIKNNLVVYGPELTDFDSAYIPNVYRFKNELLRIPGIESVTTTGRVFGNRMPRVFQLTSSADPDNSELGSNWLSVDKDFISQFGLNLIAGRSFNESDYHTDGSKINTAILNRAAMEALKYENENNAIEGSFKIGFRDRKYEIIGVVENFHQSSLKNDIEPIILFPFYDNNQYFVINFSEVSEKEIISSIESVFKDIYQGNYFDYFFLEDHFERQYAGDKQTGSVTASFTIVAIILAFVGLYGLILIAISTRYKEIGIRKALGATTGQLINHFGKQFIFLILIAICMGIPVSIYVISKFLEGYAYSISLEPWVFVLSALIIIGLSISILVLQARKVAFNNPVDSLRYE